MKNCERGWEKWAGDARFTKSDVETRKNNSKESYMVWP